MSGEGTSQNSGTSSSSNVFLTLKSASGLAKQDLFRAPDPFAIISVDERPVHNTKVHTKTLVPGFNQTFLLFVKPSSTIRIQLFNHRKYKKSKGSGFMGQALIPVNILPRLDSINSKYCYCMGLERCV